MGARVDGAESAFLMQERAFSMKRWVRLAVRSAWRMARKFEKVLRVVAKCRMSPGAAPRDAGCVRGIGFSKSSTGSLAHSRGGVKENVRVLFYWRCGRGGRAFVGMWIIRLT